MVAVGVGGSPPLTAAARQDAASWEFLGLLLAPEGGATEEDLEGRAVALARAPRAVESFLVVRSGEALSATDAQPLVLTREQEMLLERAARFLDGHEVLRLVALRVDDEAAAEWRRAALELLRWHGSSAELGLLLDLVLDEGGRAPADAGLLEAFRVSVIELGRRDCGLAAELDRLGSAVDPVRSTLIRAVGNAGDPAALPWLADQLEEPELTATALQEIGRLAACHPTRAENVAVRVRPLLHDEDIALRRHAMRTVAALRDEPSIPHLAAILHTGRPGEQKAALSALQQLTGRDLPGDAAVWWAWYREERSWLAEELPAALVRLASEDDAQVIAAARAVSERGLERDRLALELAVLLDHGSAAVRGQVCLALMQLGSAEALDPLVVALDDEDPRVRDYACRALSSLTGLALPPEAERWEEALRSQR